MLDTFVERQARTLRGNKILIGLRLLLATLALTTLLIKDSVTVANPGLARLVKLAEPPLYLQPAGLIATIVCALTVLYLLVARESEQRPALAPKLALVQIFTDLFLISALIWYTGGVDSQFVVLYLVAVSSAAFVLKWNVAFPAAAAAATLFSLITLLYSLGYIPDNFAMQPGVQISRFRNLGFLEFVQLLLLPVCAFFLTGLLSGALARRLAAVRLVHKEILEGLGEGVMVVDAECRLVYHNQALQRLLGHKQPLLSTTVGGLVGEGLQQQVQSALETETPVRAECNYRRAEGGSMPLVVRITPIRDPEEKHSKLAIVALDDNTAEKRVEEFLKHRQRLETMGQISATIAHEIRNPLASIRGAVQEIGRSLQIPENKRILLDIVLAESDRLDQIITDFLRFARMRPPRLVPVDLGRVLSDAKLLLCSRPEAKGVAISLSGDEGDPFPADPEQLRQLFLNLGLNALQALQDQPRKELNIRVRVVSLHQVTEFEREDIQERADRDGVIIELEDSGPGMSEAVQKQIFEPFFTTKSAGTGLGLAIVERIVQAHEGVCAVHSREGAGTIFRIWLPTDLRVPAMCSGTRAAIV